MTLWDLNDFCRNRCFPEKDAYEETVLIPGRSGSQTEAHVAFGRQRVIP